jgi:hypothetical protein
MATAFSTSPVNSNYFIPNVIGRQACRFIGKNRMRLAASGAPAAVVPVHTLKIFPVLGIQRRYIADREIVVDGEERRQFP